MPDFTYLAVDKIGKRQEGTVQALTLDEAGHAVRKMGINVINVKLARSKRKRIKLGAINLTSPRIDPSLKVIFFRELSTLIDAGIQLDEGLSILQLQFKEKNFSKVIKDASELVKSGHPFSEALKQHPKVFPKLVTSLIKAAELGGGLGKVLSQISHYIEREENIRKRMKSATSYPKFIFGFFAIVLSGVIFGLLPKFKGIYAGFGAELPPSTLAILSISDFVKDHLVIEIIFVAAIVVGFKVFKKTPKGRRYVDRHIFSLPIAGSLIHKTMITRMTQTLSVLLKSGVSLLDALKIAGETADNVYVDEVVESIIKEVSHGKGFGSQMARYPNLFPVMISSMISVGERSGALALMLEKIAEFNDRDFNTKVDSLSKTLEPIIMGGLGVVVCVIVLALYLPIFQMTSAIN